MMIQRLFGCVLLFLTACCTTGAIEEGSTPEILEDHEAPCMPFGGKGFCRVAKDPDLRRSLAEAQLDGRCQNNVSYQMCMMKFDEPKLGSYLWLCIGTTGDDPRLTCYRPTTPPEEGDQHPDPRVKFNSTPMEM